MSAPTVTNPYDLTLESNDNDPKRLQAFCEAQREDRNSRFKAKLLDDSVEGVRPDPILVSLLNQPGYVDPRNNLCVWARPTNAVINLVSECQKRLQELSPNIWLMPPDCLHMTVLEVAHSLTPQALAALVCRTKPFAQKLTRFPLDRPTRLVKPMLSFDNAAVALSYVPAAGEISDGRLSHNNYTYLHLRRDLFNICREHGVDVAARYATASCHLTIARFITDRDHCSGGKPDRATMASWVNTIEEMNQFLVEEYWPHEGAVKQAGDWVIGGERGFDIREGTLWYGGGRSLAIEPQP